MNTRPTIGRCHHGGHQIPTYPAVDPLSNLHAHLLFTPKCRRGLFTSAILDRCAEIMTEVCTDFGAELREFTGETDHVRLLVHDPPKVALSRLVNSLTGVSARRLRQEFPTHIRKYLWGEHFWSPSYFAGSCAGAPLSRSSPLVGGV
jgi:putative transposase